MIVITNRQNNIHDWNNYGCIWADVWFGLPKKGMMAMKYKLRWDKMYVYITIIWKVFQMYTLVFFCIITQQLMNNDIHSSSLFFTFTLCLYVSPSQCIMPKIR